MIQNPFCLKKDILSEDLQEEFSKIKCSFTANNNFEVISLSDFRAKYVHIYKSVGGVAIHKLLPFHQLTCVKMVFFFRYKDKTQQQT